MPSVIHIYVLEKIITLIKILYFLITNDCMRLDLNLNKNPFMVSMNLRELQGAHFCFQLELHLSIDMKAD